MRLSKKTSIVVSDRYANIIGHMCYAAYKLWNVCNYERKNYKALGFEKFPNWYYQKKVHKDNMWYKQLPAQSAQEVCKLLDKAWLSFFALKKKGTIENPQPPRFKRKGIPITYMQAGIKHETGSKHIRLSLAKRLVAYMSDEYGIDDTFLYLENGLFKDMNAIKQIKIYPPNNNKCEIIVIYEIPDVMPLSDNNKYLSIDMGICNLMTCLNMQDGESFIVGRKYLSLCHYYNKEIARVQSQWQTCQSKKGVQYPKGSKHISRLYKRKNNAIRDYLHKITKAIVDYCISNDIRTVIIGDIKNIRKNNDKTDAFNQKLHALPYNKIYNLLAYKLALRGITLVKQKEAYTSQCSPLAPIINKTNAKKQQRVKRGLYKDQGQTWQADCVGAYNIARLYLKTKETHTVLAPEKIQVPYVLKVAV